MLSGIAGNIDRRSSMCLFQGTGGPEPWKRYGSLEDFTAYVRGPLRDELGAMMSEDRVPRRGQNLSVSLWFQIQVTRP